MTRAAFYCLLPLFALIQGCATAFSPSEYTVNVISTEAPGKPFQVYNSEELFVYEGKTPDIVRLKAQGPDFYRATYTIKVDGQDLDLRAAVTPVYWANALNLIGFAVDFATGSMWALPSRIDLDTYDPANPFFHTNL